MKNHHIVTMQMETNIYIYICGRGYGETKSPSSCKWAVTRKGLLCYIAKLALKMIDLLYKPIYRKKEKDSLDT